MRKETILLALILFLAPANFFLKISAPWVLVHGLPVDYLYPKLFLVDTFILLYLFLRNIHAKPWLSTDVKHLLISIWLIFCGTHLFLHRDQTAVLSSAWLLAELSVCGIFLHALVHQPQIWKTAVLRWSLACMLIFQAGLGIFQVVAQHHLAGYWLLGEPKLSTFLSDIAKSDANPWKILPYGTTAHPNLLAAWLCFGLIGLWGIPFFEKKPKTRPLMSSIFFIGSSLLALYCLWLTESVTAWITIGAFIAGFFVLQSRRLSNSRWYGFITVFGILTAVILPIAIAFTPVDSISWTRRAQLQLNALRAWREHPFAGIGVNLSASQSEAYGEIPSTYRFRQPVHNAGLLWLTETGIPGVATGIFFILVVHKLYTIEKRVFSLLLFPIVFILSLDHYGISIHSGQLLMTFLLATFLKERKLHSLNNINAQRPKSVANSRRHGLGKQ